MEASGLVVGERAHVPGHRVRKTVYRLSHEGWVQAMKLRSRLHSDIVEVLAPGLDPTPMRVAEIPEIFPAYVNMTAAVSLVRRGRLDFTKLHGIGSGGVAPLLWGDTLRRLRRVFGRTEEFMELDAWAISPSSLLIVTRIAGIGKSSLVASWLRRHRPPQLPHRTLERHAAQGRERSAGRVPSRARARSGGVAVTAPGKRIRRGRRRATAGREFLAAPPEPPVFRGADRFERERADDPLS